MDSWRITVRKHAGQSGRSVFGWRVYREWSTPGGRVRQTQLAKAKTEEGANHVAAHYRERDAALTAR